MKRIEEDMNLQAKHYVKQMETISQRQSQVIDGFLQSKDKILEQTGQITAGLLEAIQKQSLALDVNEINNTKMENCLIGQRESLALLESKEL